MSSEERFGFEWAKYSQIEPNYELQFKGWIYPLGPYDFKEKKILDAGCGMGRNSYWVLKWGAEEVVAFDYDERSVMATKNTLKEFSNTKIFFKSIYNIDWQDYFDLVFSIGVIHHLEHPDLAINNLVKATKRGGKVLIWVYGYEGNEWIVKIISPIRKIFTSRIPPSILDLLTYLISIPFFIFVKLMPTKNPYFQQLKNFRLKHVHSIIFDQLLPQIARYYEKEEAKNLLTGTGLKDVEIYSCNNNSWTVIGIKL